MSEIENSKVFNDILELVEKQKNEEAIEKVVDTYINSVKIQPQYIHSDLFKAKADILKYQIHNFLDEHIGWNSWITIKEELLNLYKELYTEKEISQLIKFYSSKLGRKVLNSEDKINSLKMKMIYKKLNEHQPEISEMFSKLSNLPFNN